MKDKIMKHYTTVLSMMYLIMVTSVYADPSIFNFTFDNQSAYKVIVEAKCKYNSKCKKNIIIPSSAHDLKKNVVVDQIRKSTGVVVKFYITKIDRKNKIACKSLFIWKADKPNVGKGFISSTNPASFWNYLSYNKQENTRYSKCKSIKGNAVTAGSRTFFPDDVKWKGKKRYYNMHLTFS